MGLVPTGHTGARYRDFNVFVDLFFTCGQTICGGVRGWMLIDDSRQEVACSYLYT